MLDSSDDASTREQTENHGRGPHPSGSRAYRNGYLGKRIVKIVGAIVLLVVTGVPVAGVAPREVEAASRPNIVFILTDDMREDDMKRVGRLARLARSGTTFENAFVTNALCCPSRSSILTGQYPHNHQVFSNHPPLGGWKKFKSAGNARSNLPTWLDSAGYRTGLFGKYLNGYDKMRGPAAGTIG